MLLLICAIYDSARLRIIYIIDIFIILRIHSSGVVLQKGEEPVNTKLKEGIEPSFYHHE